jgi:hypothetical protein
MENTFDTNTFTERAKVLHDIQKKIKFLKQKEKEASEKLVGMCGDQTRAHNGYEYKMIERKGSIKYSLVPELKNVDLEPYRSEMVTYWKLNVTEQFETL